MEVKKLASQGLALSYSEFYCCLQTGIPQGCLFESQLLHFQSGSLMHLGKAAEDGSGALVPEPRWEMRRFRP